MQVVKAIEDIANKSVQVAGMGMTGTRMVSAGSRMVLTSRLQPWSGAEFAFMFLMWAAMMVAMMLPSATPMVLPIS